MTRKDKQQTPLDAVPELGSRDKKDIYSSMNDEADATIQWIKDSILSVYQKKTGEDRLSASTRLLVQLKAYDTFAGLQGNICRRVKNAANKLQSEVNHN